MQPHTNGQPRPCEWRVIVAASALASSVQTTKMGGNGTCSNCMFSCWTSNTTKKRENKKKLVNLFAALLGACDAVLPRKNSMPNTEFVWWPPKLTNSPRVELWLNSICLLCSSDIYFFYCCWRMHKHKSLWCRLLQASCMWAYLPIRTSARTLSHRSSLIGWKFNSLLCSRWLMSGG